MARNASGTHSLPAGNPVVSGTTITPTWANDTLSDLSTEVTDSLSRSGKGPMLAPIESVDGAVGAPGITFDSEPTSGLYRAGAGDVRLAILGADRAQVTATGLAVTGTVDISGGLADDASHGNRGGGALHADAVAGGASGFLTGADKTKLDNATDAATASRLVIRDASGNASFAAATAAGHAVIKSQIDPATITPTLGTDFTATASHGCYRAGGTVTLHLAVTAGAGSAWNSIATLPAGSRPAKDVVASGRLYDSSTLTSYSALFLIATTGVCSAYFYDDGTKLTSAIFAIGASDVAEVTATFVVSA